MSAPPISVTSVSKWYGDVVAVNEISYDFAPGVTGLLGPNGAGKSTLLHLIAGVLEPSNGSVEVLGHTSWRHPELYARVGLVPEREAVHAHLSGLEYVRASAVLHGVPMPDQAAREAIALVDLTDAMTRKLGGYSKGMRQRAKIAAALVHDPEVLILDEPFNGTDPRQRLQMTGMLQQLGESGRTIVFSSHILEDVEDLADDVLVVIGGRLAASGDFREIRRLMTDRPHSFTVRSSDDRALAAHLVGHPTVSGIVFLDDRLEIRTRDYGAFTDSIAHDLLASGVDLHELTPADSSLENVFSYLVQS